MNRALKWAKSDPTAAVVIGIFLLYVAILVLWGMVRWLSGNSSDSTLHSTSGVGIAASAYVNTICSEYVNMINQASFDKKILDDRMRTRAPLEQHMLCTQDSNIQTTVRAMKNKGCLKSKNHTEYLECFLRNT
jgi:hypothetical protein